MKTAKLRIAPSPTGRIHLGTTRIALLNYLYSRRLNGKLYLRIDDTDRKRTNDLFWNDLNLLKNKFGLTFADTIKQSDRTDLYNRAINKLLSNGSAYRGDDGAIYFNIPKGIDLKWKDLIHGDIKINSDTLIGDKPFALARNDGTPLYHFASVVDDIDMGITHILRGDDHLTNTAKHILLFNALDADLPLFGHIPLMLDTDGKKLSKRNSDHLPLTTYLSNYTVPALTSYILSMGWSNPALDNFLGLDKLSDIFDINDLSDSASRIDSKRLDAYNKKYLSTLSLDDLFTLFKGDIDKSMLLIRGQDHKFNTDKWKKDFLALIRDDISRGMDIIRHLSIIFYDKFTPDTDAETLQMSNSYSDIISSLKKSDNIDLTIKDLSNKYSKPLIYKTMRSHCIGKTTGYDAIALWKLLN